MNSHDFVSTCKIAFDAMYEQSSLYQPTEFWKSASKDIFENIQSEGINNFRRSAIPLKFFVPTYGIPGNGLSKDILSSVTEDETLTDKQKKTLFSLLSGSQQAEADYRVFLASNLARNTNLLTFSESGIGNPVEQFMFDKRRYSRSALNYLLGLCFLDLFTPVNKLRTVVEVGGGFGTLGEILVKSIPNVKYVDFDIAPTLNVANYYLSEVFGGDNVDNLFHGAKPEELDSCERQLSVRGAWEIESLTQHVDLFVNFISFQEMEPDIVQNYLNHADRLKSKWVLLRNMREGKQLKTGNSSGVKKQILSQDYKNMLPNYRFVANNVRPFGLKTVDDFHSELLLFERKT